MDPADKASFNSPSNLVDSIAEMNRNTSWKGLKVKIRPTKLKDLPSWKEYFVSDEFWGNPLAWWHRLSNTVKFATGQLKRIEAVIDEDPYVVRYSMLNFSKIPIIGKYLPIAFHNDNFTKCPDIVKKAFMQHRHSCEADGWWTLRRVPGPFHRLLGDEQTDGSHNVLTCPSKEHARLMAPIKKNLSEESIQIYVPALCKIALQLVSDWQELKANNVTIVLNKYMQDLAAASISRILGHQGPYQDISKAALDLSNSFMNLIWRQKTTTSEKAKKVVQDELEEVSKNPSVDSLFHELKESDYSPGEKREMIRLFFFAGHETFSASFCHFLWFLAKNKSLQTQIRDEIISIIEGAEQTKENLCFEDFIKRLTLLRSVYEEELRYHTPAWGISRAAKKGLTMIVQTEKGQKRKYLLKNGDELSYLITAAAKDARVAGQDPDQFNIDRNADEKKAHLGFGFGPHMCPGRHLVKLQVMIYTAIILFHFELTTELKEVQLEAKLSLTIKNHVPIQLRTANVNGAKFPPLRKK